MKARAFKNHYTIDGGRYDRLTSVLGYFQPQELIDWKMKVGPEEAERIGGEARAIGTRVDEIAGMIFKGEEYDLKDDCQGVLNCVEGYKRWLAEEKPSIQDYQVTCKTDEMGVAGTMDLLLDDTIVDIKCANKISPNHWLQVNMYNYMWSSMHGIGKIGVLKVPKVGILRLDKLTSEYTYEVQPYDYKMVMIYGGLLKYYRYVKGVG